MPLPLPLPLQSRSHAFSSQEDSLSEVGTLGPVQQTHVSFVSRTQFAAGASDGIVTLWNLTTRAPIYQHQLPGPVSLLLPWRNLLFAGGGGWDVRVFDWRTFEPVGNLQGHSDIVHLADKIASKLLLVTASLDKTMRLWSIPKFSCAKVLTFDDCVVSMAASEEAGVGGGMSLSSMVALFEDNTVRRISTDSGATLVRWQLNKDISPAFISVLKQSVFVAWRDSEVLVSMPPTSFYISSSCSLR